MNIVNLINFIILQIKIYLFIFYHFIILQLLILVLKYYPNYTDFHYFNNNSSNIIHLIFERIFKIYHNQYFIIFIFYFMQVLLMFLIHQILIQVLKYFLQDNNFPQFLDFHRRRLFNFFFIKNIIDLFFKDFYYLNRFLQL